MVVVVMISRCFFRGCAACHSSHPGARPGTGQVTAEQPRPPSVPRRCRVARTWGSSSGNGGGGEGRPGLRCVQHVSFSWPWSRCLQI